MQSIALLPILFSRAVFTLRDSSRKGCRLNKRTWKDREGERLCQHWSFLSTSFCLLWRIFDDSLVMSKSLFKQAEYNIYVARERKRRSASNPKVRTPWQKYDSSASQAITISQRLNQLKYANLVPFTGLPRSPPWQHLDLVFAARKRSHCTEINCGLGS